MPLSAVFKLTGLNFEQIVREGEMAETCISQLARHRRHLGCGGIIENLS